MSTMPGRTLMTIVGLCVIFGAAGASFFLFSPPQAVENEQIVLELSNLKPSDGRLFFDRDWDVAKSDYQSILADAQIQVLSMEDSFSRSSVQSLIDIGRCNWQKAATTLERLSTQQPQRADLLNDL